MQKRKPMPVIDELLNFKRYERNYNRFMNDIYRKVRAERRAANPEEWKRKRDAYIERLKQPLQRIPTGWTKADSKKIEPFTFDPVKGMTIPQQLQFERMSRRRQEEERVKAWAKRLRKMKSADIRFKTRMIELDDKRKRRAQLINYLMGKKYPTVIKEYLETIPEYHHGKYLFYRLNRLYPTFRPGSRHYYIDYRFLYALFRRQAAHKLTNFFLRKFERRQKLRRLRVRVYPKRIPWIPIKRYRRLVRKAALYFKYIPRNALQGPTAIRYKLRAAFINSLLTRKLRSELVSSSNWWLKRVLAGIGKSRSWFVNRVRKYRRYVAYLRFLATRRGRIFRPPDLDFTVARRIAFYGAMRDMRARLWNIERRIDLRYNFRSVAYRNKYAPLYRKRLRRIRRFMRRRSRPVRTYNWGYRKARRHFRRLWRTPIGKEVLPIVDLRRTTNNFFIHVQQHNRTLFVRTAGMAGKVDDKPIFVGPKRRTPFAAEMVGREVAQRLLNRGLEDVILRYRSRHSYFVKSAIKGLRSGYIKKKNTKEGRLKRFKGAFYRQKLRIPKVRAWVTMSHNGLRGKKRRRM